MAGTSLSFTRRVVRIPKEKSPSNGPYVYPAMVSTASITERSLISLNTTIMRRKSKEKLKKTIELLDHKFFKP